MKFALICKKDPCNLIYGCIIRPLPDQRPIEYRCRTCRLVNGNLCFFEELKKRGVCQHEHKFKEDTP